MTFTQGLLRLGLFSCWSSNENAKGGEKLLQKLNPAALIENKTAEPAVAFSSPCSIALPWPYIISQACAGCCEGLVQAWSLLVWSMQGGVAELRAERVADVSRGT